MRIFSATFSAWSTSSTRAPRWPGLRRAEQAGRAGADHDDVDALQAATSSEIAGLAPSSTSAAITACHSWRRHRRDRQPAARLEQRHRRQLGPRAHVLERQQRRGGQVPDVDVLPARLGRVGLGVEVRALRVELRRVVIGRARHLGDAGHARFGAARVVEQHAVADAHLVAHEVARLVVAHADPRHAVAGGVGDVGDRALVGLAFHQPVRRHLLGAPSEPIRPPGGSDGRAGRREVRCPPRTSGRIPEPRGVQVGEVSLESGSSDARRSRQPDDVPSPSSKSIGSRKYKTLANATDESILCVRRAALRASET